MIMDKHGIGWTVREDTYINGCIRISAHDSLLEQSALIWATLGEAHALHLAREYIRLFRNNLLTARAKSVT